MTIECDFAKIYSKEAPVCNCWNRTEIITIIIVIVINNILGRLYQYISSIFICIPAVTIVPWPKCTFRQLTPLF